MDILRKCQSFSELQRIEEQGDGGMGILIGYGHGLVMHGKRVGNNSDRCETKSKSHSKRIVTCYKYGHIKRNYLKLNSDNWDNEANVISGHNSRMKFWFFLLPLTSLTWFGFLNQCPPITCVVGGNGLSPQQNDLLR